VRDTLLSGTPVEIARPDSVNPSASGAVLIPDIGGLRPLFDDHAATVAERLGAPVAAIEPWPGRETLTLEERLESVSTIADDDLLRDAVLAADLVGTARVGVLGFCMGGMFTLKASGTGRFHRAVAFYGMVRIPERWSAPGQREPLGYLDGPGACPTLAIIGTADPWTPPADVDALVERETVTVVRYDGADHGFVHDPDRPAHRPDDAVDAWDRCIAFLSAG